MHLTGHFIARCIPLAVLSVPLEKEMHMDANSPSITAGIFRQHRSALALTYILTVFENLLDLLYPLMIGIAIDGLIDGVAASLLPITLTWVFHALVSAGRQLYDARIFARIYKQHTTEVITVQVEQGATTSQVAARSGLMREFVDYLEVEIPLVIAVLINFVGALILLMLFDRVTGVFSLLVLVPIFLVNMLHRRMTRALNNGLNDELEREIEIIETGESARIGEHFGKLSRWYIRLSHADVRAWLVMQPFMIGLVALVLVRSVGMGMEPGDIFASVLYMLRFSESLDQVPLIVQQYSRLQDIAERVNYKTVADT